MLFTAHRNSIKDNLGVKNLLLDTTDHSFDQTFKQGIAKQETYKLKLNSTNSFKQGTEIHITILYNVLISNYLINVLNMYINIK